MPPNEKNPQNTNDDLHGYLMVIFGVSFLYIALSGLYLRFTSTVLPMGDPFTYTAGFFELINRAHANYWAGLKMAFTANWYWLINIMLSLLSPILIKEPFSLSLVNYLMFGLATASFFRLARYLKLSVGVSFIAAWLLWLFPINFGFLDYSSVPVMGLDAMFMGILNVAVANIIIFAIDPKRIKNALFAGFSAGFAVWGRGASLPVVLMVLFCPLVWVFIQLWKERSKKLIFSVVIFSTIAVSMATVFYLYNWGLLSKYYISHLTFIKRHLWNLKDALPYFKNIPGFFFWRFENSTATIILSCLAHLFTILSVVLVFRCNIEKNMKKLLKLFALTGAFIYFCTYFINIILFTDPLMNIYNCLLIYAPMRIGMTLSVFSLLAVVVLAGKIKLGKWVMLPVIMLIVVFGYIVTKMQTPHAPPGVPTPAEIELFSRNLDELLNGGSYSMLWYRHYNPNIILYYRRKNDLPDLPMYTNKYYNDIWWPHDYSEDKRRKVREEIRKHFEEATIIIIPEYVDCYGQENPYSFYHFREEFPKYLNSPECPRLVVRMTLKEYGHRLLVLQREKEAHGQGVPLKLPYGPMPVAAASQQPEPSVESKAAVAAQPSEKKAEVLDNRPRKLFAPLSRPPVSLNNVKITVSGKSDLYLYPRAFDNAVDPNSFWEATGKYPFWVVLEYPKKVKIKKYFLSAGECTIRMPSQWQLQGSTDGLSWLVLDARNKETQWGADEKRSYAVANPKEFKFYRLYFTAGGIYDIFRVYEIGLEE